MPTFDISGLVANFRMRHKHNAAKHSALSQRSHKRDGFSTQILVAQLRALAPFSRLPDRALQALATAVRTQELQTDQPVFAQGGPGDRLWVLCEGAVTLSVSQGKKEVCLAGLERGAVFGELHSGEPTLRVHCTVASGCPRATLNVITAEAAAALPGEARRAIEAAAEQYMKLAREGFARVQIKPARASWFNAARREEHQRERWFTAESSESPPPVRPKPPPARPDVPLLPLLPTRRSQGMQTWRPYRPDRRRQVFRKAVYDTKMLTERSAYTEVCKSWHQDSAANLGYYEAHKKDPVYMEAKERYEAQEESLTQNVEGETSEEDESGDSGSESEKSIHEEQYRPSEDSCILEQTCHGRHSCVIDHGRSSTPTNLLYGTKLARRHYLRKLNDTASKFFDNRSNYCERASLRTRAGRHNYIQGCLESKILPVPAFTEKRGETCIQLRGYILGEKLAQVVAKSILNSSYELTMLDLSKNGLGDAGSSAILDAAGSCSALTTLCFSSNRLRAASVEALSALILNLRGLTTLEISSCHLSSKSVGKLCYSLGRCEKITKLDISRNRVSGNGANALATLAQDSVTLKHLDISYNALQQKAGQLLAMTLQENPPLTWLNLSQNGIGDYACHALGAALEKNTMLTGLDLGFNGIKCEGAQIIGSSLLVNSTLQSINLEGNQIGVLGGRALFRAAEKSATTVNLTGCEVTLGSTAGLFDHTSIPGHYKLNLANALERSTAQQLLDTAGLQPDHSSQIMNEKLSPGFFRFDEDGPQHLDLPSQGLLSFDYLPSSVAPGTAVPIEDSSLHKLVVILMSLATSSRLCLLEAICWFYFFEVKQLQTIISVFPGEQEKTAALALLFGRVSQQEGIHQAGIEILEQDIDRFWELGRVVGQLIFFSHTVPNGFYMLDMSNKFDKVIFQALVELSENFRVENKASKRVDYRCTCFCNATLDQAAYAITWHETSKLAQGILSFDFAILKTPSDWKVLMASDWEVEMLRRTSLHLLNGDFEGFAKTVNDSSRTPEGSRLVAAGHLPVIHGILADRRSDRQCWLALIHWFRWVLPSVYFRAAQMLDIIALVRDRKCSDTVTLLVVLWTRLVDVETLKELQEALVALCLDLSADEMDELKDRLGHT